MNQILKILFYNEYVDLNLSQSLVQLVYIRMTYSELGSKFDVVLVILRVGYLTVLSFFFLPSICKLLRYANLNTLFRTSGIMISRGQIVVTNLIIHDNHMFTIIRRRFPPGSHSEMHRHQQ